MNAVAYIRAQGAWRWVAQALCAKPVRFFTALFWIGMSFIYMSGEPTRSNIFAQSICVVAVSQFAAWVASCFFLEMQKAKIAVDDTTCEPPSQTKAFILNHNKSIAEAMKPLRQVVTASDWVAAAIIVASTAGRIYMGSKAQ